MEDEGIQNWWRRHIFFGIGIMLLYILLSALTVEIVGRVQERNDLYFTYNQIGTQVENFAKENSGEELKLLLNFIATDPQVKFVACYMEGYPQKIHTNKDLSHLGSRAFSDEIWTKISYRRASVEGFIHYDFNSYDDRHFDSIYLSIDRERSYGLALLPQKIWLALNAVIIAIALLAASAYLYLNYCQPADKVKWYLERLASGFIPSQINLNSPKDKQMEVAVNNLRDKICKLYEDKPTVSTDQFQVQHIDQLLESINGIMKPANDSVEACHNITKVVCEKLEHVVCCSLWLMEGNREDFNDLTVTRRGLFYYHDKFPVAELTDIAKTLSRQVVLESKSKIIHDFSDNVFSSWKSAYPFAFIAVPIPIGKQVMGSLCIWKAKVPFINALNSPMIILAETLGSLAGIRLEMVKDDGDNSLKTVGMGETDEDYSTGECQSGNDSR